MNSWSRSKNFEGCLQLSGTTIFQPTELSSEYLTRKPEKDYLFYNPAINFYKTLCLGKIKRKKGHDKHSDVNTSRLIGLPSIYKHTTDCDSNKKLDLKMRLCLFVLPSSINSDRICYLIAVVRFCTT